MSKTATVANLFCLALIVGGCSLIDSPVEWGVTVRNGEPTVVYSDCDGNLSSVELLVVANADIDADPDGHDALGEVRNRVAIELDKSDVVSADRGVFGFPIPKDVLSEARERPDEYLRISYKLNGKLSRESGFFSIPDTELPQFPQAVDPRVPGNGGIDLIDDRFGHC